MNNDLKDESNIYDGFDETQENLTNTINPNNKINNEYTAYNGFKELQENIINTTTSNNNYHQSSGYLVLDDKKIKERKKINKILLVGIYGMFIVIGYIAFSVYRMDKYEFYIKESEVLLAVNSSYQMELTPKNSNVFDYMNYKYETTNNEVVEVDDAGNITAVGVGEAEIKVKYKNGYIYKTMKVKTEELGNSEINSTYNDGEITSVVKGRENLKVNVEYQTDNDDIQVDRYGHVEKENDVSGIVKVNLPNGQTTEVVVPAEPVEVESIEVIERDISIKKGTKSYIKVAIEPENATDKTLKFQSDNENVTIDSNGNITGVDVGVSLITITSSNGNEAYCCVSVVEEEIKIESIELSSEEEMQIGESLDLIVDIVPEDATERELIWESSNSKIVSVENGKITALSEGSAEITVRTKDSRIKEKCKVTVQSNAITDLKVIENLKMKLGTEYYIVVDITPSNVDDDTLTYVSSNDNVTVDSNGLLTANKIGKSEITIKSPNNKTAKCTVEVVNEEINIDNMEFKFDEDLVDEDSLAEPIASFSQDNIIAQNLNLVSEVRENNVVQLAKNSGTKVVYYMKKKNSTCSNKLKLYPSNATGSTTWTSSNTSVATINKKGKITVKNSGTTTITAKILGKEESYTLQVKIPAQNLSLSSKNISIEKGKSKTITNTVSPTNTTEKIQWESSNQNVATVDENGKVTAHGSGTTKITAKIVSGKVKKNGKDTKSYIKKTKTITVSDSNPIKSIKINNDKDLKVNYKENNKIEISYKITPKNATDNVIWTSSDTNVATVDNNGIVTLKGKGTSTITATSTKNKVTSEIKLVTNSKIPSEIKLNKTSTQNLNVGKTLTLKATLSPSNAQDTLTWSSNKEDIATVNQNGKVKALKEGTVKITAKTSNNLTASVTIKVNTNTIDLNGTSILTRKPEYNDELKKNKDNSKSVQSVSITDDFLSAFVFVTYNQYKTIEQDAVKVEIYSRDSVNDKFSYKKTTGVLTYKDESSKKHQVKHANGSTYYEKDGKEYLLVTTKLDDGTSSNYLIKYRIDKDKNDLIFERIYEFEKSSRIVGVTYDKENKNFYVAGLKKVWKYDSEFNNKELIRGSTAGSEMPGDKATPGYFYQNQDITYHNNLLYSVSVVTSTSSEINNLRNQTGLSYLSDVTGGKTLITVIDSQTGDFVDFLIPNYGTTAKYKEIEEILFIEGKPYCLIQSKGRVLLITSTILSQK